MKNILVPLDGSRLSEQAIPFASALAHRAGARILLLRAARKAEPFTAATEEFNAAVQMAAAEELDAVAARIREAGNEVEFVIWDGAAGSAITEAARTRGADLIVMSTHGRTGLGRVLYGSVADQVLRTASAPVLLTPAHVRFSWGAAFRIVVALDGSAAAEEAIEPALDLAEGLRGQLVLVRAVEPPVDVVTGYPPLFTDEDLAVEVEEARRYLDAVGKRVNRPGVEATGTVAVGTPQQVILDAARSYQAGAIALATRGRGGLTRMLMGSVAERVLAATMVPLLVITPVAGEQHDVDLRREPVASVRAEP